MPTAFGLIAIPLCALCTLQPERLLQLAILGAAFEAAAVLTFGTFGVQPALLPVAMFAGYVLLQLLLGARYPGTRIVLWAVTPFILVTAWALLGSVLLPRLFAGEVDVWPQKPTPPFMATPLQADFSNINQDFYALADCVALLLASLFATATHVSPRRLLGAFWLSAYLAIAVAIWQFLGRMTGLPFPTEFFLSNPGYAQLSDQMLGGLYRINGSFTEPAALASFLSGVVGAAGWCLLSGRGARHLRILLPLALVAMIVSTSTTGYAVLALMVLALVAYALLRGSRRLVSRLAMAGIVLLPIAVVGVLAVAVLAPTTVNTAAAVLDGTLNKQESSSYQDRTSLDWDSAALVLPTWGLGVGWGSNRSSSLLPGMLADLGIYGTLGLAWFGLRVARLVRQARVRATGDLAEVIDATIAYAMALITAALLSGPAITTVQFYIMVGILIASCARVLGDAPDPASATAT